MIWIMLGVGGTLKSDVKMATKKKRPAKKPQKTESYLETLSDLENLISRFARLIQDAQRNGDLIAIWTLTHMYDDMIKTYHRLGNIRLTVKGDRS